MPIAKAQISCTSDAADQHLAILVFAFSPVSKSEILINPLVTNGFSHYYQLDESTFVLRGFGSIFVSFLFHFSMKFKRANRIAPGGTPRFAASHLGLFCLPMAHT